MSRKIAWSELRAPVMDDPERRTRVEARERVMEMILALTALRERRGMRQVDVARDLHVSQANISKLERKALQGDDLYLSTVASYIAALGGRLRLVAEFPDEEILISPTGESGHSLSA